MVRWLLAAPLAIAILAASGGCASQAKLSVVRPAETPIDGLTRLAILDFEGEGETGRIARAAMLNQFWDNKHYTLVDPAELARVHPITQADGKLDTAAALAAARQVTVDALLTGQVVSYSVKNDSTLDQHLELLGAESDDKKSGSSDSALGVTFNSNHTLIRQASVAIAVQLIDAPTGEIRAARQFTHTFDGKVVNGKGTLPSGDALLTKLLNECATDAVAMLAPHRETVEVTLATQYYGQGMAAVSRGNDLAMQGKWSDAKTEWEAVVRENHKNHAALFNLALAAEREQDYPAALRQLDAAIELYPAKLYNQTRARMKKQQQEFLAAAAQSTARRTATVAAAPVAPPPSPLRVPLPVQRAEFSEPSPHRLPVP